MSQDLNQVVAALKIRLFDAGEEMAATQAQLQNFQKTLMAIVEAINLQPEEGAESIELDKIVEAVKALVPEAK
ncbi:hypothetical protein OFDDKENP_00022 [Aeromonas phage B614]|nr:hypothetical protein OFDDKENP_00022 [Aeromonas phage B614]UYD58235.1 hypothetical protein JNEOFJEA_00156 [Aeromonas phage UP87]UYD58349.1 hypothetical protein IPAKJDPM_00006 [Aeromonas phage avDM14-QBC]UYD58813.1 hypothetical protein HNNIDBEH_00237 [Aeromonas phage avDM10-HWA]UYD58884.1 hypothetical protein OFOPOMKI_00017 [Aeromonas phage avDM7-IJDJ]UYD59944.1 hypothetical protein LEHPIFIF_00171 [Aeromonas phage avDM9-HANS]